MVRENVWFSRNMKKKIQTKLQMRIPVTDTKKIFSSVYCACLS